MKRKLLLGAGITGVVLAVLTGTAAAQDVDPVQAVTDLGTQMNILWIVIGAILVIFMQAGFALVETGFCRAKHASHVISTNFAVFGLGFVAGRCRRAPSAPRRAGRDAPRDLGD